jgi:hypothetical protein
MYATVAQANEYVESYYSSTDPLRIAWEDLSAEDRQVALNKSEQFIDMLPLTGRAITAHKSFPREPDSANSLVQAKAAAIELAIRRNNPEMSERFDLQRQGVKSYRIGDLSETFGFNLSALEYAGIDPYYFAVVFPFLRDWLAGGYKICSTQKSK